MTQLKHQSETGLETGTRPQPGDAVRSGAWLLLQNRLKRVSVPVASRVGSRNMEFTQEEVAKHNNKLSLWVVRSNKVYDVTEFSTRHPGGLDTLLENAGQDVQQVMRDEASHQHSKAAYSILEKYYIGNLKFTGDETTVRRRNNNEKVLYKIITILNPAVLV